jgi:pseudaminic acid cytidylyltransferase
VLIAKVVFLRNEERPFLKLAVIPARGGSQRIPRKNIRDFCGRPIIEYSILAALKADCFDEIMVSTDDDEIAQVAIKAGAVVPFRRSELNSSNIASTADVLLEVLKGYQERGTFWEQICCLYPTAPFANAAMLNQGLQLLMQNNGVADTVFPIVQYGHPVQRALKMRQGFVKMREPENRTIRTQEFDPSYHDAGQFYWLNVQKFRVEKAIIGPKAMGLIVPENYVQDIDNEVDWRIAETKYRLIREKDDF